MSTLKQTIKELAAGQAALKNQRKTIKIDGERTMTPLEAYRKHQDNRVELHHLYVAYNTLRSKPVPSEGNYSVSYVNELTNKYSDNIK